ncbi:hypothetical protein [Sulfuricurvum sp.]|uniref:hypothetical protein n=1 Tax=Sulfuricurvum sp. TaxID=2025608 RepID=UPI0026143374|nr:hypothetical protein [Sulfuricurvum sp.]MDD2780860.1 hypothetical protein [Sulfuricurvum sp.]
MADSNTTMAEHLKFVQKEVCDAATAADILQKTKGASGYVITMGICDTSGNTIFATDVVYKHKEDPDGKTRIYAEIAGQVVGAAVFAYGVQQTIGITLAATVATAILTKNPALIYGALTFGLASGYAVTKTTSEYAQTLTTKAIEGLFIHENTNKLASFVDSGQVFSHNSTTKKATISENADVQGLTDITLKKTNAQQLTIGTRVLDIRNLSEIELRNAVSHIDSVSFLLSEINIKVGEKLDMGSFGIYTVGTNSYDYSLSLIAKNHGMTTKELVMLNTWLVDDGRIDFLYPTKVLVDAGTIVNSVINHTIAGSMQDDVIIDHNGGTDTLIGNGGADYMDGGQGYDTYYSGNGDTIKDTDNNGRVLFEGFKLTGGVSETGCKPNGDGEYRGDGGVYKLSSGKLTFTKDGTNETLIIEKFVNGSLGITLTSKDPGASCPPPMPNPEPDDLPTPSTPNPNFPSPLVLDLNGDGVTSTFISSTSTYFDLDNDGVKQRTGWVQTTDALLALDKNQDGIINNASELFGNHTTLKNGTNAANGFEALKEYDENKDGVIDAKDNIYNTLSLWQDANSDGVTDTGELHSLSELGVASINLGYSTNTDTIEERNQINQTSTFTTTDGTTQSINDVSFQSKIQNKVVA